MQTQVINESAFDPIVMPHTMAQAIAEGRSSRWPRVREAFVVKNPVCACCGARKRLNVHHVQPFHIAPELELEPSNLITLCEGGNGINCHLLIGHCGDWKAWNTKVRALAKSFGRLLRMRAGVKWHEG